MTDPIPAATLVIVRDKNGYAPELLMVERARAMAFAGGMTVFPGGRIDSGDRMLAELLAPDDAGEAAARIAAVRETLEEVGLPVGFATVPTPAAVIKMRAALHAGEPMGAALAATGAMLELNQLTPFARWLPNHRTSRIFDARFYLTAAPDGAAPPTVDAGETVRVRWMTAAACLAAADGSELAIIFPTRRNLERLAQFDSLAAMIADAARHPVRTIVPWVEEGADGPAICIPTDLGYPVTREPLSQAKRG